MLAARIASGTGCPESVLVAAAPERELAILFRYTAFRLLEF